VTQSGIIQPSNALIVLVQPFTTQLLTLALVQKPFLSSHRKENVSLAPLLIFGIARLTNVFLVQAICNMTSN
jgi:hypothetical protein